MISGTPAWTDRCFTSTTVSSAALRGVTRAANSLAVSDAIRLQSSLRALALISSGLGTWFPSSLLSRLYRARLSLMPSSFGWRDFSDSWTVCDQNMDYIDNKWPTSRWNCLFSLLVQISYFGTVSEANSFIFFCVLGWKQKRKLIPFLSFSIRRGGCQSLTTFETPRVAPLCFSKPPITFEWKSGEW